MNLQEDSISWLYLLVALDSSTGIHVLWHPAVGMQSIYVRIIWKRTLGK